MDAHMPRYSNERKAAVLNKLLPPHNRTVVSVSAEEGISAVTLYSWLKQCRQQGMPVPGNRNNGDDWSPEAKLAAVIETAPMSEAELSAYCREKGLYPEQIQCWKAGCLQGAGMQVESDKTAQKQQREAGARTVWTRSSASQLKNQVAEYPKTHATILSSQVWRVAMPATRSSNCWAGTGSASRLFWISRSRVIAALRAP